MTRSIIPVVVILIVGTAGAYFFLTSTEPITGGGGHGGHHDEGEGHDEFARGPHNGRLLSGDGLEVEVTIFEAGMPPEFRVYPFRSGEAIAPKSVAVSVILHRLGGRTDEIGFEPVGSYLRGDRVVHEPHSFDVKVEATYEGKTSRWEYSQYEGRAELAPEAVAGAAITIEEAGPATLDRTFTLPGEIALNTDRIAHVVPRLAGVVLGVHKNLGDRVSAGELLAVLESRELADAKSEYLSAIERRKLAQSRFTREETLFGKDITPEREFLTARQALVETDINVRVARQKLQSLGVTSQRISQITLDEEAGLTRYEIRAPIDGVIIEKHITFGEAVKEDADIFVVADLSSVWAEIVVYAHDLNLVKPGQSARIRSEALNCESEGTVWYIAPILGQKTRTARAIVDLPNPDGKWRPGLFVDVELVEERVAVPVAVRIEAIQTIRDWSVVFVKYGDVFEARPLELGRRDKKWVEVLDGLSSGEAYAVENSFVIKAEIGKAGATHDH